MTIEEVIARAVMPYLEMGGETHVAQAVIQALDAAGFVVVPKMTPPRDDLAEYGTAIAAALAAFKEEEKL